ncbi:MAG TPA: hypothetical protein VMU68_04115 [Acidimicrobiales bacterium]|nr:hypothetical protein [Acidimicrobiales bacterium]
MSFTIVDTGFNPGRYSFDGPDFGPRDIDERSLTNTGELVFEMPNLKMMTDTMGDGDGDVLDSIGGEDGNVPDSIGGEDDNMEHEEDNNESE